MKRLMLNILCAVSICCFKDTLQKQDNLKARNESEKWMQND